MNKDVIIVDENDFNENIKKIKKDGRNKFFVLADFGKTLSKCFLDDGTRVSTSFAVIRDNDYLGFEYKKRALELFDKYHPFEIDEKLSREEKDSFLTEWWQKHLNLMIEFGFGKDEIKSIVNTGKAPLRLRFREFIDILDNNEIPLVIVSQGVADIYLESLKTIDKYSKNIFFISNLFEFDEKGKASKTRGIIIHPFNKHKVDLKKFDFYDKIKERGNLILLGDSLEDIGMIENLDFKNIIKIGFLNEKVNDNLEKYKKEFDVVILNDIGMDFVNEVTRKILS